MELLLTEGEPAWTFPELLARTRRRQQQAPPQAREPEGVRR
jgi:hypothetical protein